jgi:hypothetical protein
MAFPDRPRTRVFFTTSSPEAQPSAQLRHVCDRCRGSRPSRWPEHGDLLRDFRDYRLLLL